MSRKDRSSDSYSEQETQQRVEIAIRAAFNMLPKPHSDMKLSKPIKKKRIANLEKPRRKHQ